MNEEQVPSKPLGDTRLVTIGSELAIALEVSHLQAIRATPDTAFEVSCDGDSIFITPVRDSGVNAKRLQAGSDH